MTKGRQCLNRLIPRRQVKEVLWERKSTAHSHTFLLPVLIAMANPKPFVATYPGIGNPSDGRRCLSCFTALPQDPFHASVHTLLCYRCKKSAPGEVHCFDCGEYVLRKDFLCHERNTHLASPDPLCAVLFWQRLLVRPGRCPFCLTTPETGKPLERFFSRDRQLSHLSQHLESLPKNSITCPHPFCKDSGDEFTRVQFAVHLNRLHGICLPDAYFKENWGR